MLNQNKNQKIITVIITSLFCLTVIFLFSTKTLAASIELETLGSIGLASTNIFLIVSRIIQVFIGLLGVIAISLIIYAGYLWMTAAGNEEKISQAKKILVNAVIGLIIILSAFAIVSFIINKLEEATNPSFPPETPGPNFPGSAIGGGIIESVYPLPNSQNNPRNTLIFVTFKEAVAGIIAGNALVGSLAGPNESPNVQIYQTGVIPQDPLNADEVVATTIDNKTFVFNPVPLLGLATTPTNYTVLLTSAITKASGGSALPNGFDWSFGIGTFADITPPYVVSVFPVTNSTVARNALVQINFNEAINPVTATGLAQTDPNQPFNNIALTYNNGANNVPGEYAIGNQYKTVEFLSNLDCGAGQPTNSCGNPIYCLPASENFTATIKAADLNSLLNGISDAAGNSLDGDHDGNAEGPPTDNYLWDFSTNDTLDLTAPFLTGITPLDEAANIPLNPIAIGQFNETISATTINTTNYIILLDDPLCTDPGENYSIARPDQSGQYPNIPEWCWPGGFGVGLDNGNQAKLWLYGYLDSLTRYNPRLLSYITDLYQNCFNPSDLNTND